MLAELDDGKGGPKKYGRALNMLEVKKHSLQAC
jgi:hypothetical protein